MPAAIQMAQDYPVIRQFPVASGQTFVAHDLVFFDTATNGITVCGADPALILGIALCSAANASIYPNNRIPVAILTPDTAVVMEASSTLSDTNLFRDYGIVKSAAGNWKIDLTDTVATRVTVTDVSPARLTSGGVALAAGQAWGTVRFTAANLQGDGIAS